ncbi:hypothetical protein PPGU16_79900 (plasmid) [Paraburkholderia largidicola]|uniref:Uncharacterized protein n=2 Tax=Paraburkholderia largidicola TaxID=3014751 RepID=A0A7I8C269_9BURK|nr:hypothetical protein PPGU16_79900 [Paraburkholderia sp. PGU16]
MFFPGNDKLGFVVFSDSIKFWDPPDQTSPVLSSEKNLILDDIRADFDRGGHTLEIE